MKPAQPPTSTLIRKRSAARVKHQNDCDSDASSAAAVPITSAEAFADRRNSRVASYEDGHDPRPSIDDDDDDEKKRDGDGKSACSLSSWIPRLSRNDIIWFSLGLCNNVVWVIGCEYIYLLLFLLLSHQPKARQETHLHSHVDLESATILTRRHERVRDFQRFLRHGLPRGHISVPRRLSRRAVWVLGFVFSVSFCPWPVHSYMHIFCLWYAYICIFSVSHTTMVSSSLPPYIPPQTRST